MQVNPQMRYNVTTLLFTFMLLSGFAGKYLILILALQAAGVHLS